MGLGLVQLGEGMALGAPNSIPHTDRRDRKGWRRCSRALYSGACQEDERQQHKLKHERPRLEIRRSLFPMRTAQQWG